MAINMKKRALSLAAENFPVLPIYTLREGVCSCPNGDTCDRAGKHPTTPNGVKDVTTVRTQIKLWWTDTPDANIGVAAGSDIAKHGRRTLILAVDLQRFLDTLPTVKSSNRGE